MPKFPIIFAVELVTLLLVILYDIHMIATYGSSWDNIAAYFNSLTMIGKSTYYEILREPLIQLLIIPIVVFTKSFIPTIEAVTVLLSIIFLFAIRKLASALKIEGISAYMIALSGIVVGFMTILNATDILATITVIIALAYYYEGKNLRSSIFFGLSFLAKFTNLAFLLYMPLIFKGKYRIGSIVIALAVNIPWFLANYLLYGNPFYGYLLADTVFASAHLFGILQMLSAVYSLLLLTYPFIIIFLVLLFLSKFERANNLLFKKYSKGLDRRDLYLLIVALVEYVYIGTAQGFVAWLGYPVYIAFLVIILKRIRLMQKMSSARRLINTTASVLALAVVLVSIIFSAMFYGTFLNIPLWFSKNAAYNQSLNYAYSQGCKSIYSNAWPYLMLYNQSVRSVYMPVPAGACAIFFNTTNVGTSYNTSGYTPLLVTRNYSIVSKV